MKHKLFIYIILFLLLIQGGFAQTVKAEQPNDLQDMEMELAEFLKPWDGKVTLRYQNLITNESYSINSHTEVPAASTIKLPLALYIMKLADKGQIDLNEQLTYQSHHYYGGSGVIQKDPVGSKYTIDELVKKAMIYSDNIAFIMLKEKVGAGNFIQFLKSLGAEYAYPGGRNTTSADDLSLYARELYRYSEQSPNGKKLVQYLENTVYNTTIPKGIQDQLVAHKVGLIPMNLIYNDTAVVFGTEPFTLAVTTRGIDYEKSQQVIADIASIVNSHHQLLADSRKNDSQPVFAVKSQDTAKSVEVKKGTFFYQFIETTLFGKFFKPVNQENGFELLTDLQGAVSKSQPIVPKEYQNRKDEPIRLSFAGDAMFDWSVKQTVKQKGPDYPFLNIRPELESSDLNVVNLETSVTARGSKQGKQYTFRSDPEALTGLKNAGFQLVSLANNHSLDFGQTGFTDTIVNLKQYGLDYVGGGVNKDEAYSAKTYSIKGKTVKMLAFSRVLPDTSWAAADSRPGLANGYDINLIENTIQKEKADADFLFVFLHWGIEKNRTPEPFQREWARKMIDSGADGVIGSHPHVLQGFEYYKGKPVAYSLGNFLFPNYIKGNAAQTGILHIDIANEKLHMSFVPFRISQDQIVKQSDLEKNRVWKELQSLSFGDLEIQNGRIVDLSSVTNSLH
ncbi:CapA family protein [Neobacillus mesonae]|uniref:CapA family protein n=1 Tax=Neobacillus mesonae TaxID=1193713 RepID=UPI00203BD4CB|nr:CapA family protein [Neobacillus mesonae]MCM3566933.1 CapA family protein [Neobacillus mesonae]